MLPLTGTMTPTVAGPLVTHGQVLRFAAMPTVAIDARDARVSQLRGWGRYTLALVRALRPHAGLELPELAAGGRGPPLL